ncbi:hypothetical protein HYPSUDRAFT_47227 [Hypholoma sublateritium FD-334 SS-4]|uniref:Protein kinase domain-containing protein n=1 Tax=Hypholoma sublateritium (strain FD-334 SS-4) TaxID=945553 RepID=A0A0D2P8E5_HYPSF|nr:hypothetical protein HYPSUDRAFT_47227 [Hypholoma sublateritium FD-334 SS-4]
MEEGDLSGYLSRNEEHLTRKTRVNICEDIANGLLYMHSQHIIHRDLTTANVLMDSDCKAKLSDFGLSNVIAELRGASFMTSKMAGSARWAAPELFPPDDSVPEANFSTDIYSLGSVIFHVMTGKIPYEGLTETQVMLQVLANNRPPTLIESKLTPTDSFWDIINRCWEAIPASRPTVAEVGQMVALQHLK